MKKLIYISIIITGIFAACKNEIPYDIDPPTPKLVLNSLINADSLVNIVSLNYTGIVHSTHVDEATVEIRVNGNLVETPEPMKPLDDRDYQKRFEVKTRYKPGDLVRIDAYTADGKHHAWAEDRIPYPIQSMIVDTTTAIRPPKNSYTALKNLQILTHFSDIPGDRNFYRIVIEQRHYVSGTTENGKDTTCLQRSFQFWPWDDIVLTDGQPVTQEEYENELFDRVRNIYGIFDDSRIKDSEYVMNVQTSIYMNYHSLPITPKRLDVDIAVRLFSITEAQYYYLNVLNFIDSDMAEEFLTDPVKIPSNVKGGTGFLGFSSEIGYIFRAIDNYKIMTEM